MKHFLIDGYNLMHYLLDCQVIEGSSELEDCRSHLLRLVQSYGIQNNARMVVVFDNSEHPFRNELRYKAVHIIFAPPGKEADDIIKAQIRSAKTPAQLTVVSSDRAISTTARDKRINCISSDHFYKELADKHIDTSKYSTASPSPKYDGHISEAEILYWKKLFE